MDCWSVKNNLYTHAKHRFYVLINNSFNFFLDLLYPTFNVGQNDGALFQTNCIIRIKLVRNHCSTHSIIYCRITVTIKCCDVYEEDTIFITKFPTTDRNDFTIINTIGLNYKKHQISFNLFFFLKKFIVGNLTERAATACCISLHGDSRLMSLQGSRRVPRIVAGDKQANTNTSFDEGVWRSSHKTHTLSSIIRHDTGEQRGECLQSLKVNTERGEEEAKKEHLRHNNITKYNNTPKCGVWNFFRFFVKLQKIKRKKQEKNQHQNVNSTTGKERNKNSSSDLN